MTPKPWPVSTSCCLPNARKRAGCISRRVRLNACSRARPPKRCTGKPRNRRVSMAGWLPTAAACDYAFCPLEPLPAKAEQAALHKNTSLKRALWLWQLGEANYAIWEWNAAYKTLSSEQQRKAIEMAQQLGWYDRAVFSLESNELNQRYYTLASPAPTFRSSRPPPHVSASPLADGACRAESIFMPGVPRAPTHAACCSCCPAPPRPWREKRLAMAGRESCMTPTPTSSSARAPCAKQQNNHGMAYQAIGAYNAGPTPVNRWQAARPQLDPAFWIETIRIRKPASTSRACWPSA